jgi:hypothetical protein
MLYSSGEGAGLSQGTFVLQGDYVVASQHATHELLAWDTRTGVLASRWPNQHAQAVGHLLSPLDERVILSSSEDSSCHVWMALEGKLF